MLLGSRLLKSLIQGCLSKLGKTLACDLARQLLNDRLPKKLLFGQVEGLRPPGRPRFSFNDVALQDCQTPWDQ